MDIDKLLNLIDEDEVVQTARDMVAIPSITSREGMGMVNYMKRWFDDLDIPVRLYPCEGDRANFFADYGATSGQGRYLFNGHQDTKFVEGMTVDPFAGEIRDGRMYGRGACDMKGGLASILCAFKTLVRAGIKPKGGITFFSDIEEEYGGGNGFPAMLERGIIDGFEGMISCEPSEFNINIGNNGGFVTAFETRGNPMHSSKAVPGANPVEGIALFITEFLKLPYLKPENPLFGKSTVNFEKIEAGIVHATVPDRCITCLDSRLIPDTPPEMVQAQVDELITRLKREYGIIIHQVDQPKSWRPRGAARPAYFIPPDHELPVRVARAFKQTFGKDTVINGCPGATLAAEMIKHGTPAVICGPGSIAQAHTDDEWVEIEQLVKGAKLYTVLMADM